MCNDFDNLCGKVIDGSLPAKVVLNLEGGNAFGLGDHPTTQGACWDLVSVVHIAGMPSKPLENGEVEK